MKRNTILWLLYVAGILVGIIFSNVLRAQSQEINFGDFAHPVASVSSLAAYNNNQATIASGTSNVSIPLLELPTRSKNISLPLALSYSSMNVKSFEPAGEAGTGWSLFAGGVISREIIGSLNEVQYSNNPLSNSSEIFDDVYYYNLPGVSGKFKFNKNATTGSIDIESLSGNKVKITYNRDNTEALYFTVLSFTITDESGYQYIFNDYSESSNAEAVKTYRSAFFLSQIKLPDNTVIANFEYRKDSKHATEELTSPIVYKSCKLSKINADGLGSVSIDYQYDATKEKTMNDPYSISQILLKDVWGSLISGYKFVYNWTQLYPSTSSDNTEEKGRRLLDKLIRINKDQIEYEKTSFEYNPYQESLNENNTYLCYVEPVSTPGNFESYQMPGLLKRIIYPMGGVAEYNYEAHDYFFNRNTPQYLENAMGTGKIVDPYVQDWEPLVPVLNVDTNQSLEYSLTVTGAPGVKKSVALQFLVSEYYPPGIWVPDTPDPNEQPDPGGDPQPGGHYHFDLTYTLKKNSEVMSTFCISNQVSIYQLLPGTYTITISGTGGKAQLLMSQIKLKPGPYPNKISTYKYGPRLKSIKYYNSSTETVPAKTEQYNYGSFSDPISSSGYIFRNEAESSNFFPGYILYKNVSVSDGENGFVRYYFKNPNDYSKTSYTMDGNPTTFWQYYPITKSGVLEKKEVYNAQNQRLSTLEYETVFETLQNLPDLRIDEYDGNLAVYTKPAYIKKTKTTTTNFSGNVFATTISEATINSDNFKTGFMKEISSDGITTESWIRYAADKNNTQMLSANIFSVPLETETKINGKITAKTESFYSDSGRFDPLSLKISNTDNGSSKTAVKYEIYDSYGNVRQYMVNVDENSGIGFPVVLIWGYNQTMPIAKIEGARLTDIGTLADDIVLKSNADKDASSETEFVKALDLFRSNTALKNFQITTYTYDPLVGVTTTTPPNGIREIYQYDKSGRLKTVADVNGNILKEYKYNNKPQP
ncbi:hypothetical protein [Chryseobacterium sp.]|jgi:YD repeat-containing protein|uniref:hypothetical protein n=1 Tax=Chryseobacterium sp. TaxID=1871047 RepID=UPI00283F2414|nr:hypothetical protein [Chryseobacterium sp.]MDR3026167.1 hypothetical protein [Chryseobacterium sp.]